MSVALLNAEAHLILRQRLIEADEAQMAKHVRALHRTERKLRRAIAAELQNGLTMDDIIAELTPPTRDCSLAPTK